MVGGEWRARGKRKKMVLERGIHGIRTQTRKRPCHGWALVPLVVGLPRANPETCPHRWGQQGLRGAK
jgi:hypothetical protein